MNYIGMDSHITTLDFAVINESGRLTKAKSIATGVKGLVEFVKQIPAPRTIYMEEGTLAAWALETCVQYGEKLVIMDPKENHWMPLNWLNWPGVVTSKRFIIPWVSGADSGS
jgi:hypothetical protein